MRIFNNLITIFSILVSVGYLSGSSINVPEEKEKEMKVLNIQWQRLVDEKGQTCDRCGNTEEAIDEATSQLRSTLKGLNVDVVLEKTTINPEDFSKSPLQSNRIWIGGKPIEEWLSATTGKSKCCSVCGDSDCRTIIIDGRTYEAIPSELIVKAGLLAGAQLINPEPVKSSCPPQGTPKNKSSCKPGCCGS